MYRHNIVNKYQQLSGFQIQHVYYFFLLKFLPFAHYVGLLTPFCEGLVIT